MQEANWHPPVWCKRSGRSCFHGLSSLCTRSVAFPRALAAIRKACSQSHNPPVRHSAQMLFAEPAPHRSLGPWSCSKYPPAALRPRPTVDKTGAHGNANVESVEFSRTLSALVAVTSTRTKRAQDQPVGGGLDGHGRIRRPAVASVNCGFGPARIWWTALVELEPLESQDRAGSSPAPGTTFDLNFRGTVCLAGSCHPSRSSNRPVPPIVWATDRSRSPGERGADDLPCLWLDL